MVSQQKQLEYFFDQLDKIEEILDKREIFIFLDYDGTLTPIVATPDLAVLSLEMRETIKKLASHYKVSIVSGRATDDVRRRFVNKNSNRTISVTRVTIGLETYVVSGYRIGSSVLQDNPDATDSIDGETTDGRSPSRDREAVADGGGV